MYEFFYVRVVKYNGALREYVFLLKKIGNKMFDQLSQKN